MKILIIGAADRVGSAALAACLYKNHTVTAFLRNSSTLPPTLTDHPRLRTIQGDPTSHNALVSALHDQDAVIQAAIHGSNPTLATSDSERVVRCIIGAVKEVQASRQRQNPRPIRLWVMSAQVLMHIPGYGGNMHGDVFPIHPAHYENYEFLQEEVADVDRSIFCPGKLDQGEVRVLLYHIR